MIIAVTLDGWSASLRHRSSRFSSIIESELESRDYRHLRLDSRLFLTSTWKALRFIRLRRNNKPENGLLLCGKSLGAWNLTKTLLPKLGFLNYAAIAMVTVDPCRPTRGNLTPNLNRYRIDVEDVVDSGVNLYARIGSGRIDVGGPAGAMVIGDNITNVDLFGFNHFDITDAPQVAGCVDLMIQFLEREVEDQ